MPAVNGLLAAPRDSGTPRRPLRRSALASYLLGLLLLGLYYPKLGRYPLYDWLGLVAAVLTLADALHRGALPNPPKHVWVSGFFVLLSGLFTVPFAVDGQKEANYLLVIFYFFTVWLALPAVLLANIAEIRAALGVLTLSMTLTGLFAIGQALLGLAIWSDRPFWGRMTGLTRHPNELGAFCAMVLPYAFYLTVTAGARAKTALWICAVIVGLCGLFLSGSMTGAIALGVAAVVFHFSSTAGARWRFMIVIALATATFVALGPSLTGDDRDTVDQRISRFIETNEGRGTLHNRLAGDIYAWEIISKNPLFGRGYFVETENVHTLVHNAVLRAWYEGGLFCVFAAVIAIGAAVSALARIRKRGLVKIYSQMRLLFAATVSSFSAFLVVISASPSLFDRSSWFPVALVFSVSAIYKKHRSARHKQP